MIDLFKAIGVGLGLIASVFILLFSAIVTFSPTGEGTFSGKLVDVTWGGLFYQSCEISQQVGSNLDTASSIDKELCNKLKGLIGKDIVIEYDMVKVSFKTDTRYLIRSVNRGVMARKMSKPIMVYINKSGTKQLYWPKGEYDRAERLTILNKLSEMARLVELEKKIKKFEDWKKDPGLDGL